MGKITINFDLYEEILNARKKFNGFKLLRVKKKGSVTFFVGNKIS